MDDRNEVFDGIALRLGRRDISDRYFPEGLRPDLDEFDLSDNDKAEAKKTGGAGKISVWDKKLISPQGANAFFEQPNKTRIVLDVDIAKVVAMPHGLHVYCEPAEKQIEGREAHQVIENVWRSDKLARQAIQADLLSASRPIGKVQGSVFTQA